MWNNMEMVLFYKYREARLTDVDRDIVCLAIALCHKSVLPISIGSGSPTSSLRLHEDKKVAIVV